MSISPLLPVSLGGRYVLDALALDKEGRTSDGILALGFKGRCGAGGGNVPAMAAGRGGEGGRPGWLNEWAWWVAKGREESEATELEEEPSSLEYVRRGYEWSDLPPESGGGGWSLFEARLMTRGIYAACVGSAPSGPLLLELGT